MTLDYFQFHEEEAEKERQESAREKEERFGERDAKHMYALVEKTIGPNYGKVWRSEEMTDAEADRRNRSIGVMQWEKGA